MRHGVLLSATAVVVLVTGCGTEPGAGPTSTPTTDGASTSTSPLTSPSPGSSTPEASASAPSAPASSGRDDPPFGGQTVRQTGKGSGSGLVLVDVRVSKAEGFDRIVLEFSGTGTPGWVVNYVDEAVLDGSGDVVDIGGDAVLDIYAAGTTWPAPDYYSGPAQLTPRAGGDVEEVYVGGTIEGTTQVLAGVDGDPVPFRVFARTAPSRLIVDVVDGTAD